TPAAPQTLDQVLADDATLRDVAFVDAKTGWVVGDRGVVLATDDGGRHWHRQEVPLDAPLLGVHFADLQRGWIVGGDSTLYSHRTRGVVLRTIDGGITWQTPAADTLPRLTSVKFFDAATGLATGYSSAFYPSGLFATQDGGKSWQPIPAPERATWLAADFSDPASGTLSGMAGQQGVVNNRELQISLATSVDGRQARDICLTSATDGWLVGDAGRIARTTDGGATWQPIANPPLPTTASGMFDWHSVYADGQNVWIAGTPGTAIAHSSDG